MGVQRVSFFLLGDWLESCFGFLIFQKEEDDEKKAGRGTGVGSDSEGMKCAFFLLLFRLNMFVA